LRYNDIAHRSDELMLEFWRTALISSHQSIVVPPQVLILQPFNYCKNMVQQHQPISFNPMVMYRGVGANAVNMGSCTMIQFVTGGRFKQMLLDGQVRRLSLKEEMMCGIGGGSISALVGSPLELIMIQQQRKGLSTVNTIKDITKNPMNVARGFTGAMIREALWTCGTYGGTGSCRDPSIG
jgi:hypothetical protein